MVVVRGYFKVNTFTGASILDLISFRAVSDMRKALIAMQQPALSSMKTVDLCDTT